MGDGEKRFTVAVLVRQTSQWPEAVRTGKALLKSGATVSLFCLGNAPMSIDLPIPDNADFQCYADTCQAGMHCLSTPEIALQIKQCDLVIAI